MLKSFRVKLIVLTVLVLILVQLFSSAATLQIMKRQAESQADQSLDVGGRVFEQVLSQEKLQFLDSLEIIAGDYGFKSAVATEDNATIYSVLENHGQRIGADLMVFVANDLSSLISVPQLPQNEEQKLKQQTFLDEINQPSSNQIRLIGGLPFLLSYVPVQAPTTIGWVVSGRLLDKQLATEIHRLTALEAGFVNFPDDTVNLITSAETDDLSVSLKNITADTKGLESGSLYQLDTGRLILVDLSTAGKAKVFGYLYSDDSSWLGHYYNLRNYQAWILLAGILLAIALLVWVARGISRPIKKLVSYAKQIGQSSDAVKPEVETRELSLLSNTLEEMNKSIVLREKEIIHKNTHDLLTGLFNRNAAEDFLTDLTESRNGTVAIINVKKFKMLNDTIGYKHGDSILIELANRLVSYNSEKTLVARLVGDEFLIASQDDISQELAETIVPALESGMTIDESQLRLQVNVGLYQLEDKPTNANDVLRCTSIALNQAKYSTESIVKYRSGQDENYQRQLTIIGDIEEALAQNDIYLVFQPKVAIENRQCVSAEALVRWNHSQLGFISPEEFIHLAESSGNIRAISNWVVLNVIKQLTEWRKKGIDITVSINISADDLMDPHFNDFVQQVFEEHKVPTNSLIFEITETVVMDKPELAIRSMVFFKNLGIKLSIDDFGTGYSSLEYLKRLPSDELKVDKSFILNLDKNHQDLLITKSAINLAHDFGMNVVAEGVENKQSVELLDKLGCDIVQGYHFAKPMVNQEFMTWLASFNDIKGVEREKI